MPRKEMFESDGTKENPYGSFAEAMRDGREGQNVYVGNTLTKMEYADSSKPSQKKDTASTFFDDNASGMHRVAMYYK